MKIVYSFHFNLGPNRGKYKATREKIDALMEITHGNCRYFSPKNSNNPISFILAELKAASCVLSEKPDYFISRGYSGLLSILLSKLTSTTSIREIHSDPINELQYIYTSILHRQIMTCVISYQYLLDIFSDRLIYNHPYLKTSMSAKFPHCFVPQHRSRAVFNGYTPTSKKDDHVPVASELIAINKQIKSAQRHLLLFTGSCQKWHGIQYLAALQEQFNRYSDPVSILILGSFSATIDVQNLLWFRSESPSDIEYAHIMCTAVVVPVVNIRTSPGSPLKLYEAIKYRRPVFAQSDILGYGPEAEDLNIGYSVDFTNCEQARKSCLFHIKYNLESLYLDDVESAHWVYRLKQWLD